MVHGTAYLYIYIYIYVCVYQTAYITHLQRYTWRLHIPAIEELYIIDVYPQQDGQ